MEGFEEWKDSDNVIQTGTNEYRTQCTLYRKGFSLEELKEYFRKEYSSQSLPLTH